MVHTDACDVQPMDTALQHTGACDMQPMDSYDVVQQTDSVVLAGGDCGTSLLSIVSGALLPFFSTLDACTLRLLCKEFKAAVTDYQWADVRTRIRGSVSQWRACFPRAKAASIYGRGYTSPVRDADCAALAGCRVLDISGCKELTDAAFVHFKGVHTLRMRYLGSGISDAAFAHLSGVHTLDMRGCKSPHLTDAALAHLAGVHTLSIADCPQFSDAGIACLTGLQDRRGAQVGLACLNISLCRQGSLTDQLFRHCRGLLQLNMSHCEQFTGQHMGLLWGIAALDATGCAEAVRQQALALTPHRQAPEAARARLSKKV